MSNPFDFFDKIICICGKHESERWIKVQTEFEKLGILDRVERFDEVIDSDWLKETFGATSEWSKTDYCHYKIISDAHKQNLKNIFIFESDVEIINFDDTQLSNTLSSLAQVDWKLFYLGGVPHNVMGVVESNLIKGTMCQAHAYAVNGKYCKEISDKLLEEKIAIDQVYKRDLKNEIGTDSYFPPVCYAVQRMDENIPRAELPHRKLVADYKWKSTVDQVLDLHNKNISWVVSDTGKGKLSRMIRSNFVKSLKRNKICRNSGYVEIADMPKNYGTRKFGLIRQKLEMGKICFFCDTKLVFLQNCLSELFSYLKDYDMVVMADGGHLPEYDFQKSILNFNFCLVKPSDYTIGLFHPRGSGDPVLQYDRNDVSIFNDKLNSKRKFTKNIKIKILNEAEYCMSDSYSATGVEKIINFDTEDSFDKHPRTLIKNIKKLNCWYIEDEK